jgi:hypothetical protein
MILKPATELYEFLQIHQLNYKTFVEEIPQHQQNTEKMLVINSIIRINTLLP